MSWTLPLPALLLLAFAAWRDVATRTIPNRVSLALAVLGLAFRMTEGWTAVLTSLAAAAALFLVLFACHARGLLGGGDVKLLTALSLGLAPIDSWNLLLATAIAGGFLAFLYLTLQRLRLERRSIDTHASALRRVLAVEVRRIRQRGPMPYGVAIAIGGAVVLLHPQGG